MSVAGSLKMCLPFFHLNSVVFFSLGAHVDGFHTPPSSPQSDLPSFMPGLPQLLPPTSPQPSSAAPISSPPPVPVLTSSGKKSQPSTTPTSPIPSPDWRPQPPVSSNSSTIGPGVSPVHNKPGSTAAVKGQVAQGRNGGPPTSTPRTPVTQGKCVAVSPTKSPSSLISLPVVRSSSRQNWRERDSGLSQSLLPGLEAGDSQGEEVEKLLEECKTTLGITASQDGATNTAGKNDKSLHCRILISSAFPLYVFSLLTPAKFSLIMTAFNFIVGPTCPWLEWLIHFLDISFVLDMHVMFLCHFCILP